MPPPSAASRLDSSEVMTMVGLHGPCTFLQASPERGNNGGTLGDHLGLGLVQHEAEPTLDGLAPLAARTRFWTGLFVPTSR